MSWKRDIPVLLIPENGAMVHTVSCDEKPGIQVIATTGDDLRPTTETGCVYRDAQKLRLYNPVKKAERNVSKGRHYPHSM